MKLARLLVPAVFLFACGSDSKPSPGSIDAPVQSQSDAPAPIDGEGPAPDAAIDAPAAPDAPDPANTVRLSGTTTEAGAGGATPLVAVAVAAYAVSDETTTIATATSDAQGNYSLLIPYNGTPIDGYVKATKTGYVDTYLYPNEPVMADFANADITMLTPQNKDFLNQLANGGQMAGKGLVGLVVLDAAGAPVSGATVATNPASGAVRYMGANGFPSSTATSTNTDGLAFVFNVPLMVTVSAAKTGITFKSHAIKARPDVMTLTAVTP